MSLTRGEARERGWLGNQIIGDIGVDAGLLCHFDGADDSTTIVDASGNGHAMTLHGNARIKTDQSVFGGSSLYLDGSGDRATVPYATSIDLLSGDFFIGLRLRLGSVTGIRTIIGQWRQSFGKGGFILLLDAGTLSFAFGAHSEGSYLMSGGILVANQFYDVSVERSGSNFCIRRDGVTVASATSSATRSPITDVPISLGNYYNSSGALGATGVTDTQGHLDELLLAKHVVYGADYTIPSSPFETPRIARRGVKR